MPRRLPLFVFSCKLRFIIFVGSRNWFYGANSFFCAESDFVLWYGQRFRFMVQKAIYSYFQFQIPLPISNSLFLFHFHFRFQYRFRFGGGADRRQGGFARGINVPCKQQRCVLAGAGSRLMALTVNDQQNNARFCEKSANNAKIMLKSKIMVGVL